ncbi:Endoglucanase, partial [Phytophthora ramorum]|uniref:Endoglucanase n=1 Tax=Phytophthora ramorum TaxID=164328 RepID=UPI0030AE1099
MTRFLGLKADNETFHIKGINWFGGETIELVVQGLWPSATTIGDAMDLFASYDMNALRLPLAMDSVIDDPKVKSTQTGGSPSLAGKTYLEVLDVIVREARKRNILIMFDSHRIEASEANFPDIAVPVTSPRRCRSSRRGRQDRQRRAEQVPEAAHFVEGVQTNIKGASLEWGQAGGSLQGAKDYPVKLSNMERLVYSPHLISPDNRPGGGRWVLGAQMKDKNKKWADAVSAYLEDKSIGSFYWAFNPQSADTGGFVDNDWVTPLDERVALLETLPATNVEDIVAIYAKCTKTCLGNGGCEGGKCICYSGWSGPQCEICSAGDTGACNDMGTCLGNSTCACDDDADGRYCAGTECDEIECGDTDNAGC